MSDGKKKNDTVLVFGQCESDLLPFTICCLNKLSQ